MTIELPADMPTPVTRRLMTAALSLTALTALGGRAFAFEATPSGVSVSAGLETFIDATVTTAGGDPLQGRGGHFDASVLGNVGDVAVGAAVAGRPGILGDGRLLFGGRLGWQPTFGATRVQILGDAGIHRFSDVGGGLFASTTPAVLTSPYVGFQVGMTRSFVRGGHLEYGLALVGRHDLRQQSALRQESAGPSFGVAAEESPPPAPAASELRVGGTMIGISLTLGFRVEASRRAGVNESAVATNLN